MNRFKTKIVHKALYLLVIVTLFWNCNIEPIQTLPDREYELVWSDEFEGDSGTLVDPSKWVYDLGTGQNGWGNNELQSYTNEPKNISLDGNGHLVINAIKEENGSYTSARIKTQGTFEQQYGRIEAKIKTPTGTGIWPAFWMLGNDIENVGWPQCGEIDIMEQKGQQSNITYGSLHGPGYSGGQAITTPYAIKNSRFDTDYYIYAAEWGKDYIDFFVNDYLYKRLTPNDVTGEWVYDHPFFLILNVAVGGSFVGSPNDFTPFPNAMYVDYVKVYKEK